MMLASQAYLLAFGPGVVVLILGMVVWWFQRWVVRHQGEHDAANKQRQQMESDIKQLAADVRLAMKQNETDHLANRELMKQAQHDIRHLSNNVVVVREAVAELRARQGLLGDKMMTLPAFKDPEGAPGQTG